MLRQKKVGVMVSGSQTEMMVNTSPDSLALVVGFLLLPPSWRQATNKS